MEENEVSQYSALISAVIKRVTAPAFDLIQVDPHAWSKRPCKTCIAISAIIGRPFGCVLYAKQKKSK